MSEDNGIPYQSLINLYLRVCVAERKQLQLKWRLESGPNSLEGFCIAAEYREYVRFQSSGLANQVLPAGQF
jgi:hypothetical protein